MSRLLKTLLCAPFAIFFLISCNLNDNGIKGSAGSGSSSPAPEEPTASFNLLNSPDEVTTNTSASFSFELENADPIAFECSIDGGSFSDCDSPVNLSGLSLGTHTLDIKAEIEGDELELSYDWVITTGVSVTKTYPGNSNWNHFVKRDGGSNDNYAQDDDGCDGTEADYHNYCIHSGLTREVSIMGEATCTNLAAEDDLGAFDWDCDDGGGNAIFYLRYFKKGKGLKDLLNSDSWKENKLIVSKSGTATYSTEFEEWWTNPVIPLSAAENTTVEILNTASAVYTLSASKSSAGYNLDADNVSIVTLGSATLTYNDSATQNCNLLTGEAAGANANCLVASGSQNFIWIEGQYDGGNSANLGDALILVGTSTNYAKVVNVSALNAPQAIAIYANGVSNGVLFYNVEAGNSSNGLRLQNTNRVFVAKAVLYNNTWTGFSTFSEDNTIAHDIITYDNDTGINIDASFGSTVTHVSAFNNSSADYFYFGTWVQDYTLVQAVGTTGGGSIGLHILFNSGSGGDGVFSQLALQSSITMLNTRNNGFVDNLLMNAGCNISGSGNNKGLIDTTCTDSGADGSSAYTGMADSTAVLRTSRDLSNSFNADFSLKLTDTALRNKSNDGTTDNSAFVNGGACPAAVHGNVGVDDHVGSTDTFLANAKEIMFDNVGNDNGLCEDNEACIYSPNFGQYQGHGDYLGNGTCTFVDGTVSGVTMYAFPNNGK